MVKHIMSFSTLWGMGGSCVKLVMMGRWFPKSYKGGSILCECVGCVWCSRVLNSCYFNYVMNAISNSRQSYVNVGVVLLNKGCSQSMAGV